MPQRSPASTSVQLPSKSSHANWRLSDPEHRPFLDGLKASFEDPHVARAWLIKHGLLTRNGRLPKKYGG